MKPCIVIDTNVLLVADGQGAHMGDSCRVECETRLEMVKTNERVVIDLRWIILGEYSHKLRTKGKPTPGNAFLKWLMMVQGDPNYTDSVEITPLDKENTQFSEFPNCPELTKFDLADRKFVAAAFVHVDKPPIIESADSKWLKWEPILNECGLKLEVLCRDKLSEIAIRKGVIRG